MSLLKDKSVDLNAFLKLLLRDVWHSKCEIITNFTPAFPGPDYQPRVVIRYNDGTDNPPYLRYSRGPVNTYFWDIYGDDFMSIEIALFALINAPHPIDVNPLTFTFTKPKETS